MTQQNLDFLQTGSSTHFSYGYSPVNDKLGIRKSRPFGGTAIFWKKDLKAERVVSYTGEIIGVRITSFVESVVFINVYFSYCGNQSQENFDSYLGQLQSFYKKLNDAKVYILGDFNASAANAFGPILKEFCGENDRILSDEVMLPQNSFTYVSEINGCNSWIDHCRIMPRVCTIFVSYL